MESPRGQVAPDGQGGLVGGSRQIGPEGQAGQVGGSRLVLRSPLGALTLLLLCAVQFLDIVDTSIVNVALPSIQRSLHFSQPDLQWVASGYILT